MTHRFYIRMTGLFWFLMGAWLMYKGLKFVACGIFEREGFATLFGSSRNGAALLISAGLFVGFLKGKFVLSKSAVRVSRHIQSLPLPIPFWKVYRLSYWILIGSMMALGMMLNFLPVPIDLRGAIDIAIGAALFRGAFSYLWYGEPREISKER